MATEPEDHDEFDDEEDEELDDMDELADEDWSEFTYGGEDDEA